MRATRGAAAAITSSSIPKSNLRTSFAFGGQLAAIDLPETADFGVRGHVRALKRGDMPPHSQNPQKSSVTLTRSVLKLFTVFTKAGEALRANHAAEHHL